MTLMPVSNSRLDGSSAAKSGAGRWISHRSMSSNEALSPSSYAGSKRKGHERRSFDRYVNAIDELDGLFDMIVIDGRSRIYCLERSLARLAPGGIIVFDNSDRIEYRHDIAKSGMNETALRGLAPCLPYRSQTSILRGNA